MSYKGKIMASGNNNLNRLLLVAARGCTITLPTGEGQIDHTCQGEIKSHPQPKARHTTTTTAIDQRNKLQHEKEIHQSQNSSMLSSVLVFSDILLIHSMCRGSVLGWSYSALKALATGAVRQWQPTVLEMGRRPTNTEDAGKGETIPDGLTNTQGAEAGKRGGRDSNDRYAHQNKQSEICVP